MALNEATQPIAPESETPDDSTLGNTPLDHRLYMQLQLDVARRYFQTETLHDDDMLVWGEPNSQGARFAEIVDAQTDAGVALRKAIRDPQSYEDAVQTILDQLRH